MNSMLLKDNLVLSLKIGIAKRQNFDFNRLRFFGVPRVRQLDTAIFADRDNLVSRWFQAIKNDNQYSDRTKFGYVNDLVRYVIFADSHKLELESEETIHAWEQYLVEKVRLGSVRVNTAQKRNSSIKCVLKLLEYPIDKWSSPRGLFRREINCTEAYSDHELAVLLRLLHPLFNQLYRQIISSPDKHLCAQPRDATAIVNLNKRNIKVAGAITKCFSLGYFLMSYFTWGNSTTILKMKKFKKSDASSKIVYSQSVLKSRASKYVNISIGDNNSQSVPKHALKFIEKLLALSSVVAPENQHLFYQVSRGIAEPLESNHLRHTTNWLIEYFAPKDDEDNQLRPMAKRFRASGSARYLDLTGDCVGTAALLGNTPQTLSRHYTTGNPIENKKQIQAATHTLEAVARCLDINESKDYAKQQLNVEVLPYEEFLSKYSSFNTKAQKTVLGSGCKDPFGKQAESYRRKMNFSPKLLDVDHLACADILNCFSCPNQVVIEEVEDIWCLLSFREMIDDSIVGHINTSQFSRNFAELLERIDFAIFKVDPVIRRKASKKLQKEGRHPIWPEGINYLF